MVFNSESVPMGSRLFSVVGAAVPEFVAVPLPPAGVGNAASDAKAGVVVWAEAPSLLIMACTTITPAAASTMAPITHLVLPGVPVAWQPHPEPQLTACCFSNSVLSVGFWSSFGVFIFVVPMFLVCL